jgi:hypothetical protein
MALKMKSFIFLPVSLAFPFLVIPFIWKSGNLTLKSSCFPLGLFAQGRADIPFPALRNWLLFN